MRATMLSRMLGQSESYGAAGGYNMAQGGAPEAAPRELQFSFTGSAGEYFRIWIVNVALSIVTLGVYSAWAKVRTKKYFYRHTLLDGSSFDYLADPLKILKGRIIVGTFLIAMGVANQFSPTAYAILTLVLFLLSPAIMVLSTAFNARNSAYRNVRFAFQGNIGEGYGHFMAGLLVYIFTLGTGFPYLQWRMTNFIISRHTYGLERFEFSARAGAFFRIFLKAFAGLIGAIIVGGVLMGLAQYVLGKSPGTQAALGVVLGVVFVPLYFFGIAYVQASLVNLVFGSTTIGAHRLVSDQRTVDVAKLYLVNTFAVVLSLGLLIPWAQLRLVHYRAEHLKLLQKGSLATQNNELAGAVGPLGDAAGDLGGLDFDLGF
jgi:uncharacterized membrane protein YjgN (DUF898 family)